MMKPSSAVDSEVELLSAAPVAGLHIALTRRFLIAAKTLCEARRSVAFVLQVHPCISFQPATTDWLGNTTTLVERAVVSSCKAATMAVTIRCPGVDSGDVDIVLRCLTQRSRDVYGTEPLTFTLFARLLTAGLALGDGHPDAAYTLFLPTGGTYATLHVREGDDYVASASFPLCESVVDVGCLAFDMMDLRGHERVGAVALSDFATVVRRVALLAPAEDIDWRFSMDSDAFTLNSLCKASDCKDGELLGAAAKGPCISRTQNDARGVANPSNEPYVLNRDFFTTMAAVAAELGVMRSEIRARHPEGREAELMAHTKLYGLPCHLTITACTADGQSMCTGIAGCV